MGVDVDAVTQIDFLDFLGIQSWCCSILLKTSLYNHWKPIIYHPQIENNDFTLA